MSVTITKYTEIVVECSVTEFLLRCGRCKGAGANSIDSFCRVCDGSGYKRLGVPSDWSGNIGVVKCGRCKGTGANSIDSFCRTCAGVGALVKMFPRVVCGRCSGSGSNSIDSFCRTCDGIGSIWIDKIPKA